MTLLNILHWAHKCVQKGHFLYTGLNDFMLNYLLCLNSGLFSASPPHVFTDRAGLSLYPPTPSIVSAQRPGFDSAQEFPLFSRFPALMRMCVSQRQRPEPGTRPRVRDAECRRFCISRFPVASAQSFWNLLLQQTLYWKRDGHDMFTSHPAVSVCLSANPGGTRAFVNDTGAHDPYDHPDCCCENQ